MNNFKSSVAIPDMETILTSIPRDIARNFKNLKVHSCIYENLVIQSSFCKK